jgi:hypothetical protein
MGDSCEEPFSIWEPTWAPTYVYKTVLFVRAGPSHDSPRQTPQSKFPVFFSTKHKTFLFIFRKDEIRNCRKNHWEVTHESTETEGLFLEIRLFCGVPAHLSHFPFRLDFRWPSLHSMNLGLLGGADVAYSAVFVIDPFHFPNSIRLPQFNSSPHPP